MRIGLSSIVAIGVFAVPLMAQTPPDPAVQVPATPPQANPAPPRVNPLTGMVTTPGAGYVPPTGNDRWLLYWKQSYWSEGAYFGPLFTALVLDQASGTPEEWGGGFKGYGRRAASRIGTNMVQGTIQGTVAYALGEDVRYIASSSTGFKARFWHALAYSFLTYNSKGHPTLNIANLMSYYGSAAVTTTWLPESHNVLHYAAINGSEQAAFSMPVNLLQEFWPEIRRKVLRRR